MLKLALAAVAAFALVRAAPALACGDDCPMHKVASKDAAVKVAEADKAEKKDQKVTCNCHDKKECTCAARGKCDCPTCHAKTEKKSEEKKS